MQKLIIEDLDHLMRSLGIIVNNVELDEQDLFEEEFKIGRDM